MSEDEYIDDNVIDFVEERHAKRDGMLCDYICLECKSKLEMVYYQDGEAWGKICNTCWSVYKYQNPYAK